MNEQERYLKRMSDTLKEMSKILEHIEGCFERMNDNLRDHTPKEDEDGTAAGDEGLS